MATMHMGKSEEMQMLTRQYVDMLTKIWTHIFTKEMCEENFDRLVEHARNFYDELVSQSLDRQSVIEKEISDLYEEADTLRRLLKTDVVLPVTGNKDKPLLQIQDELDKSLEQLRESLRQRREQICELLLEQEALCDELGEPPRPLLADPLPTAQEIDEFRTHLEQMREERVQRMQKLSALRREIKQQLQILSLQVNTDAEDRLLNHRQMKLNKDTFVALQRMHDRYGSQVKEVRERIDNMRKKLDTLWDRLETTPNTRQKCMRHTEYTQRTYDIYVAELQRCEQLKSQNIQQYVQQTRIELEQWWQKTLKSDLQRSRFTHFKSHTYTDDLLALHEMELEELKLFYESNRQIFELFADRKILWDRMQALEAKASEPGRYNNRGGQLLREEKERKTIANKLPKIEQQITELVHAYEERTQCTFLVYGENILELMASEWERKRVDKEKLSSARKNAGQAPLSRSQMGSAAGRTPMSVKNVSSISGMRRTPSSSNLTTARPPLTLSTQKRKLQPNEKSTPIAKRSLLHALNSPSVFLKPDYVPGSSTALSANKKSAFKSPLKKHPRVISSSIIRRKSGRHSVNNIKKRRSLNKSGTKAKSKVAHNYESCTDTDGGSGTGTGNDETYDSFQKCIEPASRSSILHSSALQRGGPHSSSRSKRLHQFKENAAVRSTQLSHLPMPRIIRTPSKQNLRSDNGHISPGAHSPASTSSRKLTTKNLPIII